MKIIFKNITNLKPLITIDNKAFQENMTYVIFKNEANHILNKQINTNLFQNLIWKL